MGSEIEGLKGKRLLYSVPETAAMLLVSDKTVYRLIQRELLKAIDGLRHKRITAASIEQFVGGEG